MESPASAAGPRVYLPLSLPDSPAPTYAVLQFLGFSPSPASSSQPGPLPSSSPAPPLFLNPSPLLLLPYSSPASNTPSPAPKRCASSTESSTSSSTDHNEKGKNFTSIKRPPCPLKKSVSGRGLVPAFRPNNKLRPTISIMHTDKDTIIHTHSSNFREVVHQLTGAEAATIKQNCRAGNNEDLAMVSVVAALPSSRRTQMIDDNTEAASVPTTKLLERRKSNNVLERLSTSCRNLPLVPSPVTPQTSDFEKMGVLASPTTSEGSLMPAFNSAGSLSPLPHDAIAMETLTLPRGMASPTLSRSQVASMDVKIDAMGVQGPRTPQSQSLMFHGGKNGQMWSSIRHATMDASGPSLALATGVPDLSLLESMDIMQDGQDQNVHDAMEDLSSTGTDSNDDNESIIAKKGFFFHSQKLRHTGNPLLLALFPESSTEL